MDDPVTSELIERMAEDVLATWMAGCTDVLDDGRQRRMVQIEDDNYLLFRVENYNIREGCRGGRLFRISVHVEEVK